MNRPIPEGALAKLDRKDNVLAGIGLMVLAVFLFALNDMLGKWLAERYPAPQILLFRSIAALAILLPIVGRSGASSLVKVSRPRLQVLRAFLAAGETGSFYAAVAYLPLADAMTYYLAGPIYVTVLAALFLGERVGWRRWSAVVVGFVGVLIALAPDRRSFGWPALIALTGSILYAIFLTITRVASRHARRVMATWQIGAALIIGVRRDAVGVDAARNMADGVLLGLLGIVALGAIVCVNRSLKLAPASVVVPYQYMMIVWAMHLRLSRLRRRAAMADADRRRDHHRRRPLHLLPRAEALAAVRAGAAARAVGRRARRLERLGEASRGELSGVAAAVPGQRRQGRKPLVLRICQAVLPDDFHRDQEEPNCDQGPDQPHIPSPSRIPPRDTINDQCE